MTVVADTSPLNYLVLIGEADLLHQLYGRVLIPQAVLSELQDPGAPLSIVAWIKHRPAWLEIREVAAPWEEATEELEVGEREAMTAIPLRAAHLQIRFALLALHTPRNSSSLSPK